jgi:hypothetical protein
MMYVILQAADPYCAKDDELATSNGMRWENVMSLRDLANAHQPTFTLPTIYCPSSGERILLLKAENVEVETAVPASHGGT